MRKHKFKPKNWSKITIGFRFTIFIKEPFIYSRPWYFNREEIAPQAKKSRRSLSYNKFDSWNILSVEIKSVNTLMLLMGFHKSLSQSPHF